MHSFHYRGSSLFRWNISAHSSGFQIDWNDKNSHTEYHKYTSITDYTDNYSFTAGRAVSVNGWKKEFWPNGSKKTFTEEHKAKIKAKKSTKEAKEHHSKLITGIKKGPMSEEQK